MLQAATAGVVSIEYSNGLTATIDCSWSMPDHNPAWGGLKVQALGTEGLADMDAFDAQRIDGFSERLREGIRINCGVDANVPLLDAFLGAVASGHEPQPDGHSGSRSLAIALAAYDSVRTGNPAPVL